MNNPQQDPELAPFSLTVTIKGIPTPYTEPLPWTWRKAALWWAHIVPWLPGDPIPTYTPDQLAFDLWNSIYLGGYGCE